MIRKHKSVYESISASDVVYLLSSKPSLQQTYFGHAKWIILSAHKPHITVCLGSKNNQWLNCCSSKVSKKRCVRENTLFNSRCPSVENEGLMPLLGPIWSALVISVIWTSSKTFSELFLIICLHCLALGVAPARPSKSVAPDILGVHKLNQWFHLAVHWEPAYTMMSWTNCLPFPQEESPFSFWKMGATKTQLEAERQERLEQSLAALGSEEVSSFQSRRLWTVVVWPL